MNKTWDIRERAFQYSLRAINLYQALKKQKDDVGIIIGKQYFRSATSIGANLEEADGGETKRDFIHKNRIALKEARESRYWLRLLLESKTITQPLLGNLLQETSELIAILTTIIKKSSAKTTHAR